jgi:multiple RNA-binding domain-containing protein 1
MKSDEPQTKKRKREEVEEDGKSAAMKELTAAKRKNNLFNQNPDLEQAQEMGGAAQPAVKEKKKKKKESRDSKRVQVVDKPEVVEVVYEETSQPPDVASVMDAKPDATTSDLEWLRARTSRTLGLESDHEDSDNDDNLPAKDKDESSSSDEETEPEEVQPVAEEPHAQVTSSDAPAPSSAEAKILKTGRLFVRNLVYGITEDHLRQVFSPYGPLEEVLLLPDLRIPRK